jgi:hypothetical protein
MTRRADATLARSNRHALDLLSAARLAGARGERQAHAYLLSRVRATLVAGLELYERDRRGWREDA